MRHFLQPFFRYGSLASFLLLEVISFYLIVHFNDEKKKIYSRSTSVLVGAIYEGYDNILDYFSMQDQLESLQKENAGLRAKLANTPRPDPINADTLWADSMLQEYSFIPVEVINNSISGNNNMLTINKGRKYSIEPHMGVIGSESIVGIVTRTTDNYATVMSILHRDARISASIKGSNYFGSLVWKGNDPTIMVLEAIPKHAAINIGDTIQTNSYSSLFPENIIIGLIEEFRIPKGDNFYFIKVRLKTDLGNLQYAYVVKKLMKTESSNPEEEEVNE